MLTQMKIEASVSTKLKFSARDRQLTIYCDCTMTNQIIQGSMAQCKVKYKIKNNYF